MYNFHFLLSSTCSNYTFISAIPALLKITLFFVDIKKFSKGQSCFLSCITVSIILLELIYWILPTFMALLTGFFPCKPPFMSSLFCNYSTISRILFSILEFVLWQQVGIGAAYYMMSMVIPLPFLWMEVN